MAARVSSATELAEALSAVARWDAARTTQEGRQAVLAWYWTPILEQRTHLRVEHLAQLPDHPWVGALLATRPGRTPPGVVQYVWQLLEQGDPGPAHPVGWALTLGYLGALLRQPRADADVRRARAAAVAVLDRPGPTAGPTLWTPPRQPWRRFATASPLGRPAGSRRARPEDDALDRAARQGLQAAEAVESGTTVRDLVGRLLLDSPHADPDWLAGVATEILGRHARVRAAEGQEATAQEVQDVSRVQALLVHPGTPSAHLPEILDVLVAQCARGLLEWAEAQATVAHLLYRMGGARTLYRAENHYYTLRSSQAARLGQLAGQLVGPLRRAILRLEWGDHLPRIQRTGDTSPATLQNSLDLSRQWLLDARSGPEVVEALMHRAAMNPDLSEAERRHVQQHTLPADWATFLHHPDRDMRLLGLQLAAVIRGLPGTVTVRQPKRRP